MLQPWMNHLNIRPHWMSSLVLSNNHSERMMALSNPNYRVIVLDDEPQKYLELINGEYKLPKGESICSVLLPPPETAEYFIEGDYEKSEQIYNDYLFYNPNVNHLLATIFTLLFQNISVMIFIPQDADRTWGSINTLLQYMYYRFGIVTSNAAQVTFCMDLEHITPDVYATIIDIMFTNGTIPVSEFCLQYPIEIVNIVSDLAIQKICIEQQLVDFNNVDPTTIPNIVINFIIGMKKNIMRSLANPNDNKLNVVVNMGG